MNRPSNLPHHYPKARLQYFHPPRGEHIPPEMYDVQVLKMLQQYGMNAHFYGRELQRLEGIPEDGKETMRVAVNAVRYVQPFLVSLIN